MIRRVTFTASALLLIVSSSVIADDLKVIGAMRPLDAARKLTEIGDVNQANKLRATVKAGSINTEISTLAFWGKKVQCWQHTNHVLGFIATGPGGATQVRPLIDATNISPDASLKDQAVKVTLDRLRVFCYPGGGVHNVLFDFYGQHQAAAVAEDIHFIQLYRAQEGEAAGVLGYPIFVGLKLGKEGLRMRARTVNVKNEDDEKLLGFMNSDTFKNGLQLINTSNPLTPVVTKFATGIVETMGKKNRNIPVQDIDMGLDFSTVSTKPKLSEGSYIAIQTPVQNWDWSAWKFYPESGQVLSADSDRKPIPYNYIIFSVSKMQQ